jgi:signal transduction histidine kinase
VTAATPGELSGTVVVRDRRVVYATDGVAQLCALPLSDLVGLPYLELVAPEDRRRVAERYERRLAGEPLPPEVEIALLAADGRRVPVECRVALDGQDLLVQVRHASARMARRPRLGALADLGVAIQRERSEAEIGARVRLGLAAAGLHAVLMRAEPENVRIEWADLPGPATEGFLRRLGQPLPGFQGVWSTFARRIWSEGAVYTDDWGAEAAQVVPAELSEEVRRFATELGLSHAIGVRLDERAAARFYLVLLGGWLRPEDVPAARLFGAQVAAALDAARTIADLSRRNADLAALSRLGELAGDAGDLAAFFPRAFGIVREILGCDALVLWVLDEATGELVLAHGVGGDPGRLEAHRRIPSGAALAAALADRAPRSAEAADRGALGRAVVAGGMASGAYVPLYAHSRPIGALAAGFLAPGAARDRLDVLASAAAHFAGALASHRLLTDLRRRVSELTLLNELALASAQVDPVLLLDTVQQRICDTVGADVAAAYLRDGDRLLLVAGHGLHPADVRRVSRIAVGSGLPGRTVERLAPVAEGGGVAVPLLAQGKALGAIQVDRREGPPFGDQEIALLASVGVQVGQAVEGARLLADVRRRLSDLEAVHALAQRIFDNVPGDVPALLDAGCREVARALVGRAAVALLLSEDGLALRPAGAWGAPLGLQRDPAGLDLDGLAEEAIRRRAPATTEDASRDPRAPPALAAHRPSLALLAVPLTSRQATRGILLVADEAGRVFTDAELALANALAGELAVGLENAELYSQARHRADQLAQTHRDLERAQRRLLQQERLAALGEIAAVVAHEVRNPLGVIFNSVGSLRRLVRPEGDARLLLDIVGEEAERLNRIVGDLLDFARPSTPQLRPGSLARVAEEAVASAMGSVDGVEVRHAFDPATPPVPMDDRLVRQAVVNLAANAFQAMPRGGRLTVRLRTDRGAALLELEDTGSGIPEEIRARIFEPFFTTKAAGTGLGLAVVRRIVEGHGGEIAVGPGKGGGTVFAIRLPLDATVEPEGPAGRGSAP